MDVGFVGLGRMGMNMVRRSLRGGHRVVAHARTPASVEEAVREGAVGASSIAELVGKLPSPKLVWLMVPAGAPVDGAIADVLPHLKAGDIVVDGGNSNYKDSVRRAAMLADKQIPYLDCGTSGGIWGLEHGYCLMIGGPRAAFDRVEPLFRSLAPEKGYAHVGAAGAGHFVKMIHNGIEYGMLQAYAEGFEILNASEYGLDLEAISRLWTKGSVVRSFLLDLAVRAFGDDPKLAGIKGWVDDSGMGRWTVQEAMDRSIPAPVLTLSLQQRFTSRQPESFAAKVIAALRNQFGGHAVKKA
jgi:6-phosphogluconate dehydrogenase